MPKHKLKKDRYVRRRGGNSHFCNVFCSKCDSHILLYQKDGKGALLRLYLDRIFAPEALHELQFTVVDKSGLQNLTCPKCGALVGTPMVYVSEKRLAFRLVPGSFVKRESDGTYPTG